MILNQNDDQQCGHCLLKVNPAFGHIYFEVEAPSSLSVTMRVQPFYLFFFIHIYCRLCFSKPMNLKMSFTAEYRRVCQNGVFEDLHSG